MLANAIGRAVGAARARLGVSLKDLSGSTRLEVELLRSLELGERLVSTAKLDRIAAALGLDAFALYEGREVERALVALPRYAARSDFQHEDLPVLRRALEQANVLREVSAILGRQSFLLQFKKDAPGADPAEDGYHRAKLVRKALGKLTEPLASLPALLAEQFDIPVVVAPLATGALQAAAVRSSVTVAAAVVLNASVRNGPPAGSHQEWLVDRVSICHELAHILFDEPRGGIVDVVLDDLALEGHEKPPIEQRAGAFAAEMLIPQFGLNKLLGGEGRQIDTPLQADRMVDEVRVHFRTPAEIAVNHLYNHGYVAKIDDFRKDLIRRAQARDIPQQAPPPVGEYDAWRRVLLARTQEAHDGGHLTDGAARALLGIEPGEPLPWERDQP